MTPEALKLLKSRLPKGYRELIAKATGLSISHIDRVLAGTRSNQRVIDAALSILEDAELVRQCSLNRLNNIVNNSL